MVHTSCDEQVSCKKDNSALRLAWLFYIAAALLCAGYWVWMLFFNDNTVITVRDILYYGTAAIVTSILIFSPLVNLFRQE